MADSTTDARGLAPDARGTSPSSRGLSATQAKSGQQLPDELKRLEQASLARKVAKFGIMWRFVGTTGLLSVIKTAVSLALSVIEDVLLTFRKYDVAIARIDAVCARAVELVSAVREVIPDLEASLKMASGDVRRLANPEFHEAVQALSEAAPVVKQLQSTIDQMMSEGQLWKEYQERFRAQRTVHAASVADRIELYLLTEYHELGAAANRLRQSGAKLAALGL